jgi:hypothetical protein
MLDVYLDEYMDLESNVLDWTYLQQVKGQFFLSGAYCNDTLKTLSFPALERAGSIEIIYNDLLEDISFPALTKVDKQVVIWSNDGIAALDFPLLRETRYFSIAELPVIDGIELPSLVRCGQVDFLRR